MLDGFYLASRSNKVVTSTGIDDIDHCHDKEFFKNWPTSISYDYNSRGFRDSEWPETITELKRSIWCLGDSFTVGLGSDVANIWPSLLAKKTNLRTINVSLDGASNDWISRHACEILKAVSPQYMVIHWSYTHRCESSDTRLSDEDRRIYFDYLEARSKEFYEKNLDNFYNNVAKVESYSLGTTIIHSVVPDFSMAPKKETDAVIQKLNLKHFIPEFKKLDLARDGHHYYKKTASEFVDKILEKLNAS